MKRPAGHARLPGAPALAGALAGALLAAGLGAFAAFAAFAGPAAAEQAPPPAVAGVPVPAGQIEAALARLDSLAEEALQRSGIPGLAVAVVHGGQVVHARGYGVRKAGAPEPVDADTVFQLASLSKPVGATVVAAAVGSGRVGWDTPVVAHLPWFALSDPWVTAHVTIGDLYAHRSGLPDHAGDELEDLGRDRRAVLERLRFLPLAPFRASYAYTNFGLTAAAEAVAAAAGQDWESLSEAAIYRPLGMTATSSRHADFLARPNRAHLHVPTATGYAPLHDRQPDAQSPAGGVSSSARDMARWMTMVLQGGRFEGQEIVPEAALLPALTAQMVTGPTPAATWRPGLYGFGFNIGVEPSGRTAISHSGAFLLGAGTTVVMIPSLDLGIVVLTNAQPEGVAEALAREFTDLVQYGRIERDWFAAYAALFAPMLQPVGSLAGQAPPAEPAPARPLERYAGRYDNSYFGPLELTVEAGALVARFAPAGERFVLRHWDGDRFALEPRGENAPAGSLTAVDFAVAPGGQAKAVVVEVLNGNRLGRFERL